LIDQYVIECFVFAVNFTKQGADDLSISSIPSEDCHPVPDQSLKHIYIIGYGSLISKSSKNSTHSDTGPNIPISVKGFTRNWNCRSEAPARLRPTYLNVDKNNSSGEFNGVAFKLPSLLSLHEFDRRETYYCRFLVEPKDITILVNESSGLPLPEMGNSQFWVYSVIPEYKEWPNRNFPILQSYVDIFLSGLK
jgi:hypothetical protein